MREHDKHFGGGIGRSCGASSHWRTTMLLLVGLGVGRIEKSIGARLEWTTGYATWLLHLYF